MNPLAIGFLLLLVAGMGGSKKKKEDDEPRTSPPGVKVPAGGMTAPPPAPADERPVAPAYVPPVVQPGPAAVAPPVAPAAPTALQRAAQDMYDILTTRVSDGSGRGAYRVEDVETYKAFQRASRLNTDGFPGKGTMDRLKGVLSTMGLSLPSSVPVYPWRSVGSYDGVNAPKMVNWDPSKVPGVPAKQAPPPPAAVVAPASGTAYGAGRVVAVSPSPSPQATTPVPPAAGTYTSPSDILSKSAPDPAGQSAISMAYAIVSRFLDGSGHGPYRKSDQAWYKAFQQLGMGSKTPDGFPGMGTMAALAKKVSQYGITLPSTLPVFPWKSAGAYDGKNAPRDADWNAPAGNLASV